MNLTSLSFLWSLECCSWAIPEQNGGMGGSCPRPKPAHLHSTAHYHPPYTDSPLQITLLCPQLSARGTLFLGVPPLVWGLLRTDLTSFLPSAYPGPGTSRTSLHAWFYLILMANLENSYCPPRADDESRTSSVSAQGSQGQHTQSENSDPPLCTQCSSPGHGPSLMLKVQAA